jgi:hypothetical protein
MQRMELKFSCSGWCEVNTNANFMFSGVKGNIQSSGPCYNKWNNWVNAQWRSINGCVATIVFLLFFNILSVNWRILLISKES